MSTCFVMTVAFMTPMTRFIPVAQNHAPQLHHRCCRAPIAVSPTDDPYSILGVSRDASDKQIKQAYRKLALRSHPDVNKAPDAEAIFTRIAEAYATLSDPKQRAAYDRSGAGRWGAAGASARSSSGSSSPGWGGFDPSDPVGWATGGASNDPAAAAARAERQRRWREENPTPDELGDSFGSLFSDVISAVGSAVAGSGDWLSLLDELALSEGPELQSLLRSRDVEALAEELENTRWVQTTLASRIERLTEEVKSAEGDLADFRKDSARSAGSMAKSYERELTKDLKRRTERVADAKRLLTQAQSREQRIQTRIDEVTSGGGGGSGGRSGPPRTLPSVDDELAELKRKMGGPQASMASGSGATSGGASGSSRSSGAAAGGKPQPLPRAEVEKLKAGAIKAMLKDLGVETASLVEKRDLVEALLRAQSMGL